MTLFDALILGLLQGITEFFPISSTGHLLLLEHVMHVQADPLSLQVFNVLLHGGTLLALLLGDRERWWSIVSGFFRGERSARTIVVLLIVASIPAAVLGILFEDEIARILASPNGIASTFFASAAILIAAEKWRGGMSDMGRLTVPRALAIGVAQALALLPGLSRSGMTISAGQAVGLNRTAAVDFSFMMAVPVIAGAVLVSAMHIGTDAIVLPSITVTMTGFISAFIAGLFAMRTLRYLARTWGFSVFVWYLMIMGTIILLGPSIPVFG